MIQIALEHGKLSGHAVAAPTGIPADEATSEHDTKYLVELGQPCACVPLGSGFAIIGMLAYGWWMNHFPARADRFFYRSIHADIGYVVLLLMVLRLVWRGINPTPALPAGTSRWQRIAAHISHWALYLVTILVAMLGWAHSGAAHAELCGLVRAVSRAADHLARQGRGRRL